MQAMGAYRDGSQRSLMGENSLGRPVGRTERASPANFKCVWFAVVTLQLPTATYFTFVRHLLAIMLKPKTAPNPPAQPHNPACNSCHDFVSINENHNCLMTHW